MRSFRRGQRPFFSARLQQLPILIGVLLLAACSRDADLPPATTTIITAGAGTAGALKIEIATDGLYAIALEDLNQAGLGVDVLDYDQLNLTQAGENVPYLIQDKQLLFYGQAPASRYTAVRPYIIRAGEAGTAWATTAVNATATGQTEIEQWLHLEENLTYVSLARSPSEVEPWYWRTIQISEKFELPFELPAVTDGSGVMTLRLWGTSYSQKINPDHDLDIAINDQPLTTLIWDGETEYIAVVELPAGTLQTGANTLQIDNSVPSEVLVDVSQLDWINLSFGAQSEAVNDLLWLRENDGDFTLTDFSAEPLVIDVQDPGQPVLLTGWDYDNGQVTLNSQVDQILLAIGPQAYERPQRIQPLRETAWAATDNQFDMLIVTTDPLVDALGPLVAAREAQGLRVAVVPVDDIYDAFGYGEASPESILAFVTYAATEWAGPAPRYLFLVGDATRDYRGYVAALPAQNVPSLLVDVNFSGETVSDARLADIDGDQRPELAVGRWPVSSAAEVEALVARTLAYEAGAASNQAIFAADGTDPIFAAFSQGLADDAHLTPDDVAILDGPTATEVAALWNDGAWLVTYTGHGSVDRWGKDEVFSSDTVSQLGAGSGAPPIVLQLTCLTGLFAHPDQPSISETMLLSADGPVLLIAATSLTVSNHQRPFALAFINALLDPTVERAGDALQIAKAALNIENNDGLREISDTFGLLGDPSALIVRPAPASG